MKTILMLIPFLLLLGSCLREEKEPGSGEECFGDGQICLSFAEDNFSSTRAFGNSTATTAEKKVNSAKIFIFKSGSKIFEKVLSTADLAKVGTTPVTFTVSGMQASTAYDYYVIINHGDVTASSPTDLQNISETDVASYNGAWSTVNDAAVVSNRAGGFVMTGNTTATTSGTITDVQPVTVTMKRITAKLDVSVNIDQTVFGTGAAATYQGTVSIDSVKVFKTQAATPLIKTTPLTTTGTLNLAKQIPNAATVNVNYQNRFYVFENGAISTGSRVLLNIYATYTNGSVSTPVIYPVELSTDNTGAIVRNGAYAINITISGLTGANISMTITLSDWETLVTQNTSVGS